MADGHVYWACESCDLGWYGKDDACWGCGACGQSLDYVGVTMWRAGWSIEEVLKRHGKWLVKA